MGYFGEGTRKLWVLSSDSGCPLPARFRSDNLRPSDTGTRIKTSSPLPSLNNCYDTTDKGYFILILGSG